MSELFMIVNTNFFDDFCQLEEDQLCSSSWETAEMVMKLLGWRISMSDDKRLPFGVEFQMLGRQSSTYPGAEQGDGSSKKQSPAGVADIGAMVEDLCSRDSIPSVYHRDPEGTATIRGRPHLWSLHPTLYTTDFQVG